MMTTEQMMAAHKSNVDVLFGLTNKAFEGVEKLVELNLQVARAAIGEAADGEEMCPAGRIHPKPAERKWWRFPKR